MCKDDLYKVNIDYAKEKYNHLKKEFVESAIYYYIEQYKQSVNQLIETNIEFAKNSSQNVNVDLHSKSLYYEFVITDKFLIDNINLLPCIEYNEGLNEHKYALGSNTIIHSYNTLIVHINC